MNNLEKWLGKNLPIAKEMSIEDVLRQTLWAGFNEGLIYASKSLDFHIHQTHDLQPIPVEKVVKETTEHKPEYRIMRYETNCLSHIKDMPKKGDYVVQKKTVLGNWHNISKPFSNKEDANVYLQERIEQDFAGY